MPTTVDIPEAPPPPEYVYPAAIHARHPQFSEHKIRELARSGEVAHNRGPRNAIRFTPEQVEPLLAALANYSAGRTVQAATPRSRRRQRLDTAA
jgi:hypothetical protein